MRLAPVECGLHRVEHGCAVLNVPFGTLNATAIFAHPDQPTTEKSTTFEGRFAGGFRRNLST